MNPINNLLRLVSVFASARKVSDARASTLIFGDGTRVKHLRSGGDMGVKRVERAMVWLSGNWPEGAIWPDDISRPAPHSPSEVEEAA
ncbi:MAG: hypothetical protein LCH39_01860 [Proteobacteria bacterium]|nr:hypothetical protein [Pseudomonadota bacterium]